MPNLKQTVREEFSEMSDKWEYADFIGEWESKAAKEIVPFLDSIIDRAKQEEGVLWRLAIVHLNESARGKILNTYQELARSLKEDK